MFEKLGDDEKVTKFQHLCGLRWKDEGTGVPKTGLLATVQTNGVINDELPANVNKSVCNGSTNHEKMTVNKCIKYDYIPWVHVLFHLSSSLGDEQVLIALLSFSFWNFDPDAIMQVYICLATSLYLGQGAKDVFMAPRPRSPPVIRVEKKYAEEYSMPSTHAMMGMVVPFSLVYFTHEKFEYHLVPALIAATMCCVLVGASRVYLGMHSVKDVLMGLIFECAIICVTFPFMKDVAVGKWCQTSPNALSTAIVLPAMLLLIYPTSTPKSYNTYSDTALVLGNITGSMIALRYSAANEKFMMAFLAKTQLMSNYQVFGIYMLRFATGTTVLAITRVVMKWFITSSLSKLMPASMILKPLGYKRFVDIPHKFVTYGMVAFNCVYLVPKVFELGGI